MTSHNVHNHIDATNTLYSNKLCSQIIKSVYITLVAKERPTGRMQSSKDFLWPLCQILDSQLRYLWCIYLWKYPKFTFIMWSLFEKILKQIFLRPPMQYFNEIWPVRKKSGHLWYKSSMATKKVKSKRETICYLHSQ